MLLDAFARIAVNCVFKTNLCKMDRKQNDCQRINNAVCLTDVGEENPQNECSICQRKTRLLTVSAPVVFGALFQEHGLIEKKWVCPSACLSVWLVINNTATIHQLIMAKALCVKPVVGIWLNASICPLAPCFVLWLRFWFSMNSGKFDKQQWCILGLDII